MRKVMRKFSDLAAAPPERGQDRLSSTKPCVCETHPRVPCIGAAVFGKTPVERRPR